MKSNGLTAEAVAQLYDGVNLVLSRWDVLQVALNCETSKSDSLQKTHKLRDELFRYLTRSQEQVDVYEIAYKLKDFMGENFAFDFEDDDGIPEKTAELLVDIRLQCLQGNYDLIKRLKEANALVVPPQIQDATIYSDGNSEDDDDNDGNMEEDKSSSEMEVDDAPQCPSSPNRKGLGTNGPSPKEAAEQVADGWTRVTSRGNRRGRK